MRAGAWCTTDDVARCPRRDLDTHSGPGVRLLEGASGVALEQSWIAVADTTRGVLVLERRGSVADSTAGAGSGRLSGSGAHGMRRFMRWTAGPALAVGCALLVCAENVCAQSASDKVAAETLFREARALMESGDYGNACEKFAASLRLDRGVGTLLNLADCYEKSGRTASAWAQFQEASAAARDAGSPEREEHARQRARALEPRLSRLLIRLAPGQPAGVEVRSNGQAVDPALLGSGVPTDPGQYQIEARVPGVDPWSKTVRVPEGGGAVSVSIPLLQGSESLPSATGPADAGRPAQPVERDQGTSGSWQRPVALTAGAIGLVGIGVGTYFGLKAKSSWDDADSACPSRTGCDDAAVSKGDDAQSQATWSTIGFSVAGVGLAAAAVLWLTAPDEGAESAGHTPTGLALRVGPGSIALGGRY